MTRQLRNDPAQRVQNYVMGTGGAPFSDADLAAVAPDDARWMAEHLVASARELHQLRRRLLARAEPQAAATRACVCGAPLAGRADQRYCSAACRQRAHRRNGS